MLCYFQAQGLDCSQYYYQHIYYSHAIIINLHQNQLKLKMDPRPINFQYRRPRLSNPTYSSYLLYASIYQPHSMNQNSISGKIGRSQHNSPLHKKIQSNSLPPIDNYPGKHQIISPSKFNAKIQIMNPENSIKKGKHRKSVMKIEGSKLQKYESVPNKMQMIEEHDQQKSSSFMEKQVLNKNRLERVDSIKRNVISNYRKENAARKYRFAQEEASKQQVHIAQPEHNSLEHNQGQFQKNQNKQFLSQHYLNQHSHPQPRKRHSTEPSKDQILQNNSYSDSIQTPSKSKYQKRVNTSISEQDYIYNKQQKPYNIITGNPMEHQSMHRVFPRITLENRMIERGEYMPNLQQNHLIY